MFGDISAWFYESLAGINVDPEQPAFKHIIIYPRPAGDLEWVRAEHQSIYGPIAVGWKRENGTFILDLTVPVGATAEVYLPTKEAAGIIESSRPAREAPGVKFLRTAGEEAVFEVGSGTYKFISPHR